MNTLVSPTDKTALHGSKTHTCIIRWTQILASLFEKREKKKKKKKKEKEKNLYHALDAGLVIHAAGVESGRKQQVTADEIVVLNAHCQKEGKKKMR